MAVVIRLMRAGAKKRPFYRVVAADSRRQRDGRFLEILGYYNPISKPHELKLEKEAISAWIARGARPSEQVESLLRANGVPVHAPKTTAGKPKVAKAKPAKGTKRTARKARPISARKAKKKAAKKVAKKAA